LGKFVLIHSHICRPEKRNKGKKLLKGKEEKRKRGRFELTNQFSCPQSCHRGGAFWGGERGRKVALPRLSALGQLNVVPGEGGW